MNEKVRIIRYLLGQQFLESLSSPKVICGYLLGSLMSVITTLQYLRYTGNRNISFCEPTILIMINPVNRFVIFIGLILVLSNPPFITKRSVMMFYRITRKVWGISTLLYIIAHTFLYYGVSIIIPMLLAIKNSYTANVWSRAMVRLVSVEKVSGISEYGLSIPDFTMIEHISPGKAIFFLYFANCFCGILLLLLAYLVSIRKNAIWGNMIVLMIQFVGLSVCREYMGVIPSWTVPFSLIDLELIVLHNIPYMYVIEYFIIGVSVEIIFVLKLLKHMELHTIVGEKYEQT